VTKPLYSPLFLSSQEDLSVYFFVFSSLKNARENMEEKKSLSSSEQNRAKKALFIGFRERGKEPAIKSKFLSFPIFTVKLFFCINIFIDLRFDRIQNFL